MRGLVLVVAGLMVVSFIMPWWTCTIVGETAIFENAVTIYPYGLRCDLAGFTAYTSGADMPVWFAPLMWTYLGVCVVFLLLSLFVKEKMFNLGKFRLSLPQMIIGGIGITYIVVVVLAIIIAAIRTGDFYGTHLIGHSYFFVSEFVQGDVYAGLQFGYWLACGVGPLCIALALLSNKIIGMKVNITNPS